ncbi:MAG: 50S ribosomal protein L29 [bacterium]
MKMDEIRQLSPAEVAQRYKDAREELNNLRFQLATHQLDNQVKVRIAHRNVARLATILREFELGIRKSPEKATKPSEAKE